MENAVPSVASGYGPPRRVFDMAWPYCGNSKRRKERCRACAKYRDRPVLLWGHRQEMPVLLFFIHEGQPITVAARVSFRSADNKR